jgi:hypothetical protein
LPVSSRAHNADYARRTLLLLVAIVLGYARLEQLSRLVVFGENDNLRFLCLWSHKSAEHSATLQAAIASRHGGLHLARRCRETYAHDKAPAEAGAPVEPIIVLQLVDLDALAIVGRWRYQCHSRDEGLRHSGQGQHALQSVARDRDALRNAREQLAGAMGGRWMLGLGARWRMTIG